MKDDISLAQWALIEEHRANKITTLDLPKIARKEFNLNGIELVNTLFEVPTVNYLDRLLHEAHQYNIQIPLIMIDDEGDGCSASAADQKQFAINHFKWVDIAAYLGCAAIRTNCRGFDAPDHKSALDWAVTSYLPLLEYTTKRNIKILIENHGGISNDPDWMVQLFQKVNHPMFGSYPDWREPTNEFDNKLYLQKMLPYSSGMSYRNQPTESLTEEMIHLCKESGYKGWYGIESNGRDAVYEGIRLLKKYLHLP
jgi:L-ribulose-5-phosphate 3-epimerase